MEVKGYKAFNSDMTNNYGEKFEEGKTYHVDGPISFGVHGNGFHMCKRIEDTFRYVDPVGVKVAKVVGFGDIGEGYDEYNGYFDMYSVSDIKIEKIMSREEIITEVLKGGRQSAVRFIVTGFTLTSEEVEQIRNHFNDPIVDTYIKYYIDNDKEAFKKELIKRNKI